MTSPSSYQPSWADPSLFPTVDGVVRVWQRDLPESPHGDYWMPSSSGSRSGAAVSLSSLLEPTTSIPLKYYLSPTACVGILRRAARRGKALPAALDVALRLRAAQSATTPAGADDACAGSSSAHHPFDPHVTCAPAPTLGKPACQPVACTVHSAHSSAMTGGGIAAAAFPTDVARCVDTTGGHALSQGGPVVLMKTPCAADDAGVVPLRDVGTLASGNEEGVAPDSSPCGDPMHLANPVDNPVDCVSRTGEAPFSTIRTNYWNNSDAVAESKMLVLGEVAPIPIQESGRRTGRSTDDLRVGLGVGQPGDPMYTLQTDSRHAVMTLDEGIVAFDAKRDGSLQASTPVPVEDAGACGGSAAGDRESVVLAFQTSQSDVRLSETHATLDAHNGSRRWNGVLTIDASGGPGQPGEPMRPESVPAGVTIPFDLAQITSKGNRSRADIRSTSPSINASGQLHVAHALTSHAGRNEVDGNYICVTGDTAHALTHDGADASEDGTGRGTPIIARMVAIGEYIEDTQASTLKARDAKDATDLVCQTVHVVNGDETPKVARDLVPALRADQGSGARHAICGTPLPPRRITPRECERLMGLPDDWTLLPNASDAARYRGCGNAEVTYVVQWIGERLRRAWHGITQP